MGDGETQGETGTAAERAEARRAVMESALGGGGAGWFGRRARERERARWEAALERINSRDDID